nr:hypothetical protein Iba_scaffold16557CG0010 [Ipomoea batatas]GME19880.1 hypothetical protein Iba_scaffold24013CG0130 [Ipomoea batatas]
MAYILVNLHPRNHNISTSHDGMDSQHISFPIFAERSSQMRSTTVMILVWVCGMRAKGLRFGHGFFDRLEISSSNVQRSPIFTRTTWSSFAKESIELWQRFSAGSGIVTHNFERAEVLEEILHRRDLLPGHPRHSHGNLYVVHCPQAAGRQQAATCFAPYHASTTTDTRLDVFAYTLL